jgi:hypothetical protein
MPIFIKDIDNTIFRFIAPTVGLEMSAIDNSDVAVANMLIEEGKYDGKCKFRD